MRTKITKAQLKEAGITKAELNTWVEGVAEVGRQLEAERQAKIAKLSPLEQVKSFGFRDTTEYAEGADWYPAGDPDFNLYSYFIASLFGRRIDIAVEKTTGDVYLNGAKSSLKVKGAQA